MESRHCALEYVFYEQCPMSLLRIETPSELSKPLHELACPRLSAITGHGRRGVFMYGMPRRTGKEANPKDKASVYDVLCTPQT